MSEPGVEYHYASARASHDDTHLWVQVREVLLAQAPPPRRALDLGCGNGFNANRLAELGYAVTGIDTSESGIAAGQRAYPKVQLSVGSVYHDLAARHGRFPLVVSLEVVEHCFEPRKFAATFFNLLEPGGLGIISTPFHGYWKNLAIALTGHFDRHVNPLWDGGHIKFFSPATLGVLLTEAGFSQIRFLRTGRIPPLAKSMVAVCRRPQ